MFSFVGNAIGNNGAKFLADFFAVIYGAVGHAVGNTVMNILGWIWNFVSTIIWYVCQWVLGFLDAMQLAFSRILGLDLQSGTSTSLGEYIDGMKDSLANALGVDASTIGITAGTCEGLGFVGAGKGITVTCYVLLKEI